MTGIPEKTNSEENVSESWKDVSQLLTRTNAWEFLFIYSSSPDFFSSFLLIFSSHLFFSSARHKNMSLRKCPVVVRSLILENVLFYTLLLSLFSSLFSLSFSLLFLSLPLSLSSCYDYFQGTGKNVEMDFKAEENSCILEHE